MKDLANEQKIYEDKIMKINESTENNSLRSHLETIDTQVRKIAIHLGISKIPADSKSETARLLVSELIDLADSINQRLGMIHAEILKLASKRKSGE